MTFDAAGLRQFWPMPTVRRPITLIGAGAIVRNAHLPAYAKAGFPVAGIYDIDSAKAAALAAKFGIRHVHASLEEAIAMGTLFDLATPPEAHADVLEKLPDGATVLIQKPMGRDLDEATRILTICRDKNLIAAVNFQLRFAPMMLAIGDAVDRGLLGRLVDVEVRLSVHTPWHLFPGLQGLPRVEIAVNSIHYLDLIRAFLGDPLGVHAKTIGRPGSQVTQTRTSAILDYGPDVRCTLSINHDHAFGRRHQVAEFRFEGTAGAAHAKLGVLVDYPKGEPDEVWIRPRGGSNWILAPLRGAWFPDAFAGRMANVQRFAAGEDRVLVSDVEDAWTTMALVEAAYASSAAPATALSSHP